MLHILHLRGPSNALSHLHQMSLRRAVGKNRLPRRQNQGPWRTTDKGISPSEQNQSQIKELSRLSSITLGLERTIDYSLILTLSLSKWECPPSYKECAYEEQNTVFLVHMWQQLDESHPVWEGRTVLFPEMQDCAPDTMIRRYYNKKTKRSI